MKGFPGFKPTRAHKYGIAPKEDRTVDGIAFASKKEATRYAELKMLVRAGRISNLTIQPRFPLYAGIFYVADFQYIEDGLTIVEDVKGFLTAEYKLKKKLFLSIYQATHTHRET